MHSELPLKGSSSIEQLIYAKTPHHLRNSINQPHLENGPWEKIVSHFETELELNGLEAHHALDAPEINTVTQRATLRNPEKPKPTCHHCKKPGHYRNQCPHFKREKDQAQNNRNSDGNNNNDTGG